MFTAIFKGQVGFIQNTVGTVAVAVHHGPLPVAENACTPIFEDSVWTLKTLLRKFGGGAVGEDGGGAGSGLGEDVGGFGGGDVAAE